VGRIQNGASWSAAGRDSTAAASLKVVFHVKHDALHSAAAQLDLRLGAAAVDALIRLSELLRDRAAPLGFISAGDAGHILERHVIDSLRAAPHLTGASAIDLGSGAGLPGLPVAIARPDIGVTLLEAQRRRVAFLEMLCDKLGVRNAAPRHGRAESFNATATACLARAFAPMARSWAAAVPLLEPGGSLIYFAGAAADVSQEVAALTPSPGGVRIVAPPVVLASAGPLVIMTVQ
jgi:16S rRNA (guanine527-N7)-methyltransferase